MFLGSCHRVRTCKGWIAVATLRKEQFDKQTLCQTMCWALIQAIHSHLSWGVSGVPQGISQMLARPSSGVDHFDWQARVALSSCGCVRPIGLCDLFPHDCVETWAGLVSEHKPSIVIISVCVDEESSTEVHGDELIVTWLMVEIVKMPFRTKLYPHHCNEMRNEKSIYDIPTAMPGSQLTVCTNSLPWCRTTQLGSICEVPLGSRGTIWNLRKSVSLMAKFSGHTS